MSTVELRWRDKVLQNFQAQLSEFGERDARVLMRIALNKKGTSAYVAVKRNLVIQTGVSYDQIGTQVHEVKASEANLVYKVHADGQETNLMLFKPYSGARMFTAAPWGVRHAFPRTFQPNRDPGRYVFHRWVSGGVRKIKPSFGPNISVEMMKEPIPSEFEFAALQVFPEIARLCKLKLAGLGPFGEVEE